MPRKLTPSEQARMAASAPENMTPGEFAVWSANYGQNIPGAPPQAGQGITFSDWQTGGTGAPPPLYGNVPVDVLGGPDTSVRGTGSPPLSSGMSGELPPYQAPAAIPQQQPAQFAPFQYPQLGANPYAQTSNLYGTDPAQNPYLNTNPLVDPFASALLERGMREGNMYDILTPEGFSSQFDEQFNPLKEAIGETGRASTELGILRAREAMQQAGKFTSSATPKSILQTSELYGAQAQERTVQAGLAVRGQLYGERQDIRGTLLESGKTAVGIQAQERLTGAQLFAQEKMAQLNADTQIQVTQINDQTSRDIANINADVTLDVADRNSKIQALQIASNERISLINQQTDLLSEQVRIQGGKDIETLRQEGALALEDKKGTIQLSLMDDEQDYYTDETGVPMWAKNFNLDELTKMNEDTGNPYAWDMFVDDLSQRKVEFDLTTENGMTQFWANMSYMRDNMNVEDTRIRDLFEEQMTQQKYEFDISTNQDWDKFLTNIEHAENMQIMDNELKWDMFIGQITENARQFDLADITDQVQFDAMMEWSQKEFNLSQGQIWDIFSVTIMEQARATDLTNRFNIASLAENIAYSKTKDYWDDQRERELNLSVLNEQIREYDLNRADDWSKYMNDFNWTVKAFGIESSQNMWYLNRTLDNAETQITDAKTLNYVKMVQDLANDPIFSPMITGTWLDKDGNIMTDEDAEARFNLITEGITDGFFLALGTEEEGGGENFTYDDLKETVFEALGITDASSLSVQDGSYLSTNFLDNMTPEQSKNLSRADDVLNAAGVNFYQLPSSLRVEYVKVVNGEIGGDSFLASISAQIDTIRRKPESADDIKDRVTNSVYAGGDTAGSTADRIRLRDYNAATTAVGTGTVKAEYGDRKIYTPPERKEITRSNMPTIYDRYVPKTLTSAQETLFSGLETQLSNIGVEFKNLPANLKKMYGDVIKGTVKTSQWTTALGTYFDTIRKSV